MDKFYIIIESEASEEEIRSMFKQGLRRNTAEIEELKFQIAGEREKRRVLPKIVTEKKNYAGWGAVSDFISALNTSR